MRINKIDMMDVEEITEQSKKEVKSDFLKDSVFPYCEYMKGEGLENTKKGLIVIAVDGDKEADTYLMSLFISGNKEHLVQGLSRVLETPQGKFFRDAVVEYIKRNRK